MYYNIKVNDGAVFKIEPDSSDALKGLVNGANYELDLLEEGKGGYHLIYKGRSYNIEQLSFDADAKTMDLRVNGNTYQVAVSDKYDELLKSLGMDAAIANKMNELKAPMPGLVLDVMVKEGTPVSKGDSLLVLEAMKMENVLKAPADGVVKSINVDKKSAVEKNQVLISFE